MKHLLLTTLSFLLLTGQTAIGKEEHPAKQYIIKYKQGMKSKLLGQLKNKNNKIYSVDSAKILSVKLNPKALLELQNNSQIEYIEEDSIAELQSQRIPYAVSLIQADQLSDQQASNIKVCIVDTGLQTSHEDFDGIQITGSSFEGLGLDWDNPSNGHGTYMAGAIIARNNALGSMGALPNGSISIHAYRVADSGITTSSLVDAVYNCRDNNANIISFSLNVSKTRTFQNAIKDVTENSDMLVLASSGNDGSSKQRNYPASFPEVLSIGAVDRFEQLSTYSNTGSYVEFVAPGDAVFGTEMMGNGKVVELNIAGDTSFEAPIVYNSVFGNATGNLIDCGTLSNGCPGASQNICLIEAVKNQQNTDAQENFFINEQILACENEGGLAAIFYNTDNEVQYAAYVDLELTPAVSIPAITISYSEKLLAKPNIGLMSSVNVYQSNYIRAFGTSISSPYVAAAASLVWSYHSQCSAEEIHNALAVTAKDLGEVGKDNSYGYGLPQALDAKLYLDANPCGTSSNLPPTADFSSSCDLLSCNFDASLSTDSDGSIVSYQWDFGDGSALESGMSLNHSYALAGNYTVTLTVVDDQSAQSSLTNTVSVSNSAVSLSVNGYKVKGKGYTELSWSGIVGSDVKIYRNNTLHTTVTNNGFYTDFVGQRGVFNYQICETDDSLCSDIQSVTF